MWYAVDGGAERRCFSLSLRRMRAVVATPLLLLLAGLVAIAGFAFARRRA